MLSSNRSINLKIINMRVIIIDYRSIWKYDEVLHVDIVLNQDI